LETVRHGEFGGRLSLGKKDEQLKRRKNTREEKRDTAGGGHLRQGQSINGGIGGTKFSNKGKPRGVKKEERVSIKQKRDRRRLDPAKTKEKCCR